MKILCIIPARAGSKGLPNKNVANFQGRPLIHWPILYVLESGIDLDLLVYTDGKEIADAAEELGEFTPVSRCQSLSLDTTTTEVTLRRALEQMEIYHNVKYDCVLFLTCTEIFRDLDWLNQGLQKMLDNEVESTFVVETTYKNFWIINKSNEPKRIRDEMKVHGNRQEKRPMFQENSGLCCFTRPKILNEGYRLGNKVSFLINETIPFNVDIHSQKDLDLADHLLEFYRQIKHPASAIFDKYRK